MKKIRDAVIVIDDAVIVFLRMKIWGSCWKWFKKWSMGLKNDITNPFLLNSSFGHSECKTSGLFVRSRHWLGHELSWKQDSLSFISTQRLLVSYVLSQFRGALFGWIRRGGELPVIEDTFRLSKSNIKLKSLGVILLLARTAVAYRVQT